MFMVMMKLKKKLIIKHPKMNTGGGTMIILKVLNLLNKVEH